MDDFRVEKINAGSVTINGKEFELEGSYEKYSDYIEKENKWDVKVYFTVILPPYTGTPMAEGMRPHSDLHDISIAELSFSDGSTSGKYKVEDYARNYDPFTKTDTIKFRALEVDKDTPISDGR
jgi:hypothetical protein